uniref:Uncharacterized protein n=1 Tax=Anopheles farauti TaxID=69004 RepID=A0A182QUZ5_9DIPT
MDNVFHQTDETFYETQYNKGFPGHPLSGDEGTTVTRSSVRPASANDGGLQMKQLLESESGTSKEQQYRERWHQLYRSQKELVGGQRFLRTVDSLSSVKQLTHGTKSKVESNFANILFPGHNVGPDSLGCPDRVGDAKNRTVTYGKRTNSDHSGGCLWKIFNHEISPTPPPAFPSARHNVSSAKKEHAEGTTLQRCISAPCSTYNTITQEADHQDTSGINKALGYLHKLRTLLSHTGAVQRTKKEIVRYEGERDWTVQGSDWNALLLKNIGSRGTLDYGLLEPLLRILSIAPGTYDGFVKFLDLLDSEVSLTRFELGKHMQQS